MQLTFAQCVFIVLRYNTIQNTTAVENAFLARFPDRNHEIIVPLPMILRLLKSQGQNVFSTEKQANIREYSLSFTVEKTFGPWGLR